MKIPEGDQLPVAGNGLLHRRLFLKTGLVAGGALLVAGAAGAAQEPPRRAPWMRAPGEGMSPAGAPSSHERFVERAPIGSQPGTAGTGVSRTPLQHLDGIITPSRLHFERHHAGIPDIDPDGHRLYIHGLVERPLSFDVAALHRYPQVSAIQFLECSGNSAALTAPNPVLETCAAIHGLISASEWGGVPVAVLLDEAGVKPEGKWIVADGADSAVMARSIPLAKVMDDAIVALYQNGERLRPANGYPMRLFLPGWEGNASVKWLRSIRVTGQPAMTKDETSKYSDLRDDGVAELFTFPMAVKSVITSPSPGLSLRDPGVYQISGLAWSGHGRIRRVEVSADGGASWAEAALDTHVLPKCVTRFRAAWRWDGGPAVLMSRAEDETGALQPTRAAAMAGRERAFYHFNGIQAWRVDETGASSNVYI
ncbi:MAG TPA: sulfite dehydrogenase [Pseudomonadales bacterium]